MIQVIGYIVYKFEGTVRHNFFMSEEYLKNADAEKSIRFAQ